MAGGKAGFPFAPPPPPPPPTPHLLNEPPVSRLHRFSQLTVSNSLDSGIRSRPCDNDAEVFLSGSGATSTSYIDVSAGGNTNDGGSLLGNISINVINGGGVPTAGNTMTTTCMVYLPTNVVLCDLRHDSFEASVPCGPSDSWSVSKWRPKDQIVSASQAGEIQFLDIRYPGSTYLTINAHRGSLTALVVHRHAPIIAGSSAEQWIKVFSLDGHLLETIPYFPTFMAQKIGLVSCLTFHPYQVLLANGAADACVSIYAVENSQGI